MTDRFIDPASIEERRAAWFERGYIRRIKEMPLQLLLQERIRHCKLYHAGDDFAEGCWQCHLIQRHCNKRMSKPRMRAR